ncbi:MAG: DUF4861 family protein [Ignavibacteriales bacterium]|nr:DUF4861 family protein [Ignavibacteriales bacterium]MCB9211172.1 DUF4861 family protein [Ignavibacteriales bacterium]MCB9219465.1 DUF4861 family protein [Ignavibacteriales bacterium]MCB9259861.1 DUF4861 family protein [Ignavibacteriales bacterium]
MKKLTNLFVFLLTLSFILNAQDQKEFNFFDEVKVSVTNPADVERKDELVSLSVDKLKSRAENFNKEAFIIYLGDKEIPSQLYNDGLNSQIVFACYFKPNQSKEFSIKYLPDGKLKRKYDSRTYAELAMKFDAVYKYDPLDKRNKYTSDHFENFTKVVVPENHTDHDALFKYEGPGWESEKVGYRFYLDWRNATDIFGKTINKLVLDDVGTNDVTAHEDSYHEMQDWGMDIFKVGNTLGIGSIGMMNADSIYMVSKTDEISCEISFNGPILSEVTTNYKGWLVGENKYDLVSKLSISAGSRITNATLKVFDNASNITTGLAKYKGTDFIKSSSTGDWQYIALWGKQTLNDDNLGIVLFYKKSALINQSENDLNYYVELKPIENKVNYGFAAAWEKEPDGIKTKEAFVKYIDEEIIKLNSPLTVDYK